MISNRYARDWSTYSQQWEQRYSSAYDYLGDEWNSGGGLWDRDDSYFSMYAERWLRPDQTVLEIGPGGGKWTVRLASKVKRVIVLDVAEEMLDRTRQRCEKLGQTNIEYILGNGQDFQPVADESINFFFSYDVFVHIAPEDSWPYTQEMARVLVPDGVGICHYANDATSQAWDRIEQNNDWYRFGAHTLGQYYYYSPLTLQRMYEHCGLRMLEQHLEAYNCTCVFSKPSISMAPQLESLLKQLISQQANDAEARAAIVTALRSLPGELGQRLDKVLAEAGGEEEYYKRIYYAALIRQIWRGM
ncbi:MAG: class I SAM-dependent methyltransferase [Ktedonobacteraceae bacterium]|nr:class I SAM-dependent methyltransferase [Chloroflexota bacterium]